MSRVRQLLRIVPAVALTSTLVAVAPANAAPPAQVMLAPNDFCLSQCDDIMPPGQNGNATFAELLAFQLFGLRPPHSSDTRATYDNLVWGYQGLTDERIGDFYNDASFGVPADQVESRSQPRSDVTITRDRATGVPHIQGTTRAGTMFGAGFAAAADRLFLMDALRHVARGELTPFAGGAQGNREFEQQQWQIAPYTEADYQAMFDRASRFGAVGLTLQEDTRNYVAGINAYIASVPVAYPGEYVAIGGRTPQPWNVRDVMAIASLVGGLFGGGGGGEVESALALIEARARYGDSLGTQMWRAFRSQNDPEAPTTVHNGQSFPYLQTPDNPAGRVLPDRGSVTRQPVVVDPSAAATTRGAPDGTPNSSTTTTPAPARPLTEADRAKGLKPGMLDGGVFGPGIRTGSMSNALVVSGQHTQSGNPVAVFGPQTGYFAPQILLRQELQGPGISSRGAAFPGISFYVLLGRGVDYSWSATSASQDITDSYAVDLCEPNGGTPTRDSMHYLFRGQCLPIEVLSKRNSWTPNLADSTPAGSYTLVAQRTKLGLVSHRGTVSGRPVAFTRLRSTYLREGDSALGFQQLNDPGRVDSPQTFADATSKIGFAFNWFYVDSAHTAYFNSGDNPVRAAGADPHLPTRGEQRYEWAGWNPDSNDANYIPLAQHPQVVDQDYLTSWNNKQAPGYSAADGNYSFGAVHRSQPLDSRIAPVIAGGGRFTRAGLVSAMADAATVDLRGAQVLPLLLRVLNSAPVTDPAQQQAVAALTAWQQAGAHRRSPAPGVNRYDHADAIRIMDAWWPRLVAAQFQPGLGADLFGALRSVLTLHDAPGHRGSAFQSGWYGYVHKDLRRVLGEPVAGGFPNVFCGSANGTGNLAACRTALLGALGAAIAAPPAETYPADADCAAGDQFCHDSIIHQPIGGITHDRMHWVNRPTFQQAVQFPAHRGQNIANLALGRPVSATSTESGLFYSLPARNAVDGDPATRWGSRFSDPQSITVDLGAAQPVSRVILRWEAAYGLAYRIEVSGDGASWRPVAATTAGNGGEDNVTFAPTPARFVRMTGTQRATGYGYSLWELEVYAR
ncbi:MAG TPA: penicillin acylase family protein [Actinophytocola sp.]|uniref:penicillin acylase family protein n=1 Tax=Actinophytocola sp. TaxID=1872138 RepID=UPI002DC03E64|nr:penicillin acylase family protein [Actinophytocola sp.]HEU5473477.1 penicillin acylase family protein [Actinophytocola sp.]